MNNTDVETLKPDFVPKTVNMSLKSDFEKLFQEQQQRCWFNCELK